MEKDIIISKERQNTLEEIRDKIKQQKKEYSDKVKFCMKEYKDFQQKILNKDNILIPYIGATIEHFLISLNALKKKSIKDEQQKKHFDKIKEQIIKDIESM